MAKSKPIEVDILDMELSKGLPHWLDPIAKYSSTFDDKRRQNQIEHANQIQADAAKQRAKRKQLAAITVRDGMARWRRIKARAEARLKDFDEGKHPRVPAGSPDGGQFTSGGGGEGGSGGGSAGTGHGGGHPAPSAAPPKAPAAAHPGDAVPGYSPGVKAAGNINPVRDQWVKESPVKTIEDVVRSAPVAQRAFGDAGRAIAAKLGVKFKDPGAKTEKKNKETGKLEFNQKGVDRIKQKIAEREGAPVARITDTARGTFVLNTPADAQKVIDELGKTHELLVENWRTVPSSWYTDRALLFRDRATGLIGEVQLANADMLDAKDKQGGHELYEKTRALPKGDYEIVKNNLKMRMLYGKVLDNLSHDWKIIDGRKYRPG